MSGTHDGQPPRLERFGPKTLSGLIGVHNPAREDAVLIKQVGAQWDDMAARHIAACGSSPKIKYGVFQRMRDGDTSFEYFCGTETAAGAQNGFAVLQIPALYCAVFQFTDNLLHFRSFMHMLFGQVLPAADLEPAPDGPGVPEFIERYNDRFDHRTGDGGLEVLIPLKE